MTRWTRPAFGLALVGALCAPRGALAAAPDAISVPPPVSGRGVEDASRLEPADVLARTLLVQGHINEIRLFMGLTKPPSPITKVSGASPRQVYYQSINLYRRARELAFEHLRIVPQPFRIANGDLTPAMAFDFLDRSLEILLRVEQSLGMAVVVAEEPASDSTTDSDVMAALLEAGTGMNAILAEPTTASDAHQVLTAAMFLASRLHARTAKGFLPPEPPFEPNKTSADVYGSLLGTVKRALEVEKRYLDVELDIEVGEEAVARATPDDVIALTAILVAELTVVASKVFDKPPRIESFETGRHYPSHNLQLARRLDAALVDMGEARRRRR